MAESSEEEEEEVTNRVREEEEEEEEVVVYRMRGVSILSCEVTGEVSSSSEEEEVPRRNPNKKLKTHHPHHHQPSIIFFDFHFHHHQRRKLVYRYLNMEERVVEEDSTTPDYDSPTHSKTFQVPIYLSATRDESLYTDISSIVSFMFQKTINAPSDVNHHDASFIQGIVSTTLSIIDNTTKVSSEAAIRVDLTTQTLFVADEYDIAVETTLQRSQIDQADDRGCYTTPASLTAIEDALETTTYHHHSTITASSCSVCLDDMETGDHITYLPCAHFFHADCIREWLLQGGDNCPNCRLKLLPFS